MFNKEIKNPKNYILHSGGANGADYQWEFVGREFGLTNFNHYWYYKPNPHSKPKDQISDSDYEEGCLMVQEVNKKYLRRKGIEKYMHLLARNWAQVKYSDTIFAIGTLYGNMVNGGTAYATFMGIIVEKPLYVYEQYKKQWYFWHEKSFEVCVTPVLVKDFAGIGTREINDDGIQAIRNVYEKTFGKV